MAQVHPSRLGLVPGGSSSSNNNPSSSFRPPPANIAAGAPRMPVASSSSDMYDSARREEELRARLKERNGGGGGDRDRGDRDGGDSYRPRDGDRDRERRRDDDRDYRSDRRDRDRDYDRDRERDRGGDRARRASPSYQPYQRRALSPAADYMALEDDRGPSSSSYGGRRDEPPHRGDRHGGPPRDTGYGGEVRGDGSFPGGGISGRGGGGGFRGGRGGAIMGRDLEVRRKQRDDSKTVVWPASPPREHGEDDDPEGKSMKPKSKSKSKSSRKDKHKSSKSKSSKRSKRKYSDDSDSDSDDSDDSYDRRKRSKRSRKDEKSRRDDSVSADEGKDRDRRAVSKQQDEEDEDDWVVRDGANAGPSSSAMVPGGRPVDVDMDDDDGDIGPQLPEADAVAGFDSKAYAHMRPGEGAAMAAFAAAGERIPRRGEIGLSSEQIEAHEKSGYVMSGSRHRRMNAVRMRKENQIITQEEKRGLLKLQKEENDKKEAMIRNSLIELVNDKLASQQRR